jgi:predicted metal-binding protein
MYDYRTNSGKIYPLEIGIKFIESKEIIHDYSLITNLCRTECKNFNFAGGCPPRAPKFEDIQSEYKYSVLMYAKLYSSYKSVKVKQSNRYYIHYRSQDIILHNCLTKQGYTVMRNFTSNEAIFLNNGYCMGCGSKRCAFKSGENICKQPKRRTFSLEATGINVAETLKSTFGIELQWYNKENYQHVEYMIKVVGFFCKSSEQQAQVIQLINNLFRG